MNQPAVRGRKSATAPGASDEGLPVIAAYRSAAPTIAAAASTARIDSRRGTSAATAYPATPSTRPTSRDGVPKDTPAAAAAVATARKGSGHRLPNEITVRLIRTAIPSPGAGVCFSRMIATAQPSATTAAASPRRRRLVNHGRRGGRAAGESVGT